MIEEKAFTPKQQSIGLSNGRLASADHKCNQSKYVRA